MRLRTRLVLLVATAALGPLGLLGLSATWVASRLLEGTISELQARTEWPGLYVTPGCPAARLINQQGRAFAWGAQTMRWCPFCARVTPRSRRRRSSA
ncbi:MAG: hypothetical protein IPK67_19420 [Planctomycetes bacterium]|nr:hypothetical protein [Planctomycetota bacterium]